MTVNIERPEFSNGLILREEKPDPRNYQFAALRVCKAATKDKLPKKYSIKKKFLPVFMQPCNNCTTNAVLGADAYYYHKPDSGWVPSTKFTYYNQHKVLEKIAGEKLPFEDSGSSIFLALKAVKKYGACNSKVWPDTKPFNEKPSKAAYTNGLKGKEITKYYQVKSLLQLKKALAKGYPVVLSLRWAFTTADSTTWILDNPTKEATKTCGGHAVVAVGYDDEKKLIEIRNSWGPNWCNNGYAYVTYDAMKLCADYNDTYAVIK